MPASDILLIPENFPVLAEALVRLEAQLSVAARTELTELVYGRRLPELARALREATDPGALTSAAALLAASEGGCTCSGDEPPEPTQTQRSQAAEHLLHAAVSAFTKLPQFREKLATLGLTVGIDAV